MNRSDQIKQIVGELTDLGAPEYVRTDGECIAQAIYLTGAALIKALAIMHNFGEGPKPEYDEEVSE